jgi:hypothetical protein
MNITGVLARVFVPDLEAAIPLYQELSGASEVHCFGLRDIELARVGPFLLLAGNTAAYRDRLATILAGALAPVITAIEAASGQVTEGPAPAPMGTGSSPAIPTAQSLNTSRPLPGNPNQSIRAVHSHMPPTGRFAGSLWTSAAAARPSLASYPSAAAPPDHGRPRATVITERGRVTECERAHSRRSARQPGRPAQCQRHTDEVDLHADQSAVDTVHRRSAAPVVRLRVSLAACASRT